MNKTKIEWVKNPDGSPGYTWNPITGCLNGCPYCYARKLANGRLKSRYLANKYTEDYDPYHPRRCEHLDDPFYPRFWEDRLGEPIEKATPKRPLKPKGIFVCDMSDLFGIGIPEIWTGQVMTTIKLTPWNRYYLLTKQPQNPIKFSPFPDNCWCGVTVTKPEFLLPALDALDSIQCSVRYLSIEPMLAGFDVPDLSLLLEGSVDWLILGSQTKPTVMPKIEWVEEIVGACDKAGIPVFLKDSLYDLFMNAPHSDLFWEDMSHLRQEVPAYK